MNDKNITDQLYYKTEDIGFIALTYFNAGSRNLYTKDREVKTVADVSGLKTRVQPSQTSVSMIEAFGGLLLNGLWRGVYSPTIRSYRCC